ncbi:MAG: 3-oxoacyl-ACP reductase family protein [Silicimonas sp.]|uniref:Short chain dehydrogenase n=1 Tax=Dinoroseobacter shibae (strain DSM 16493 / NCIMB 14021 / DFL 12) TaxID=398580 RepID=A8LT76_DINSH|nr:MULTISPECIES: 3-oxoacyl-ACP reductase family protein [Roseobacteraceae]ABV95443.1 short chain dehydrogenase [Dinoroseobacter shibae DFL 12 = DSM 16493]KJS41472.1 MAG: dehydrogenase [Roseovarius sp. BRH_c41]URF48635.1 3-oxoacyl-ACP reductase FabG [Dinoroseobacter shibae]URF52947.1 3-oxoacyl-ACP reductase FabG [Dinoroseobacter shibae]
MPRLDGKVAIITGAAQGIGAVYAQALADEGAKVMIADILDGNPTASRISAQGGTADFMQTDVSDESSVAAMVDATVAKWGGVDILINNAAIWASLRAKPFEDISPEEWDKLMAVNVKGPFLCARAVVPHMRAGKYGRIVNIASGTAYKGTPNFLHYVTSKGAVIAMTRALAREVGEDGITVNTLAPGLVLSEQVVASPELLEKLSAPVMASRAIKRDQLPQDLVGPLLFLVSDDAAFMTGEVTVIDGGSVMH